MYNAGLNICQGQVKTDQGHQKLRFEHLMCDYATIQRVSLSNQLYMREF